MEINQEVMNNDIWFCYNKKGETTIIAPLARTRGSSSTRRASRAAARGLPDAGGRLCPKGDSVDDESFALCPLALPQSFRDREQVRRRLVALAEGAAVGPVSLRAPAREATGSVAALRLRRTDASLLDDSRERSGCEPPQPNHRAAPVGTSPSRALQPLPHWGCTSRSSSGRDGG